MVLDADRNISQVQADIVIGADGIGSSVARLARNSHTADYSC